MAIVYKVWICIEAYDTATGEGKDVDAPGASLAAYESEQEAWNAAVRLTEIAEQLLPAGIIHDDSADGGIEPAEDPALFASYAAGRAAMGSPVIEEQRTIDADAPDVPEGLMPRIGVFYGCGSPICTECYEPKRPGVTIVKRIDYD